ncbi:MAG: hypothetical protein Q8M65_10995 [Rhodoglobus sp.]|nr:hypothetical protein [Rhodoglobus sp.]
MKARNRVARAAASAILASALIAGTAGCTFITPIGTLVQYDPTDGISGRVGTVDLRNVVAIISEDGKAISLVLTMINTGDRQASMKIQFDSSGSSTTIVKGVPGGAVQQFGNTPDEDQILVLKPDAVAGGLLPVYFQYGDNEGQELLVPVLYATGIYEDVAPPEILR